MHTCMVTHTHIHSYVPVCTHTHTQIHILRENFFDFIDAHMHGHSFLQMRITSSFCLWRKTSKTRWICMYVYVHVGVCVCVCVCVCVWMHLCLCMHVGMYASVCGGKHRRQDESACMYKYVCVYAWTCVYVCITYTHSSYLTNWKNPEDMHTYLLRTYIYTLK